MLDQLTKEIIKQLESLNLRKDVIHVISFSGGRTSAFLVFVMEIARKHLGLTVKYLFMDTGAEHPKTYDFIRNVVAHFDIDLVCLRLKATEKLGIANNYVKLELDELKTDLVGWKEMIVKYSTPYMSQGAFCTRAMKTDLFEWYCNEHFGKKNYRCWLGMRADEPGRMKPEGERVSKKRKNWYEGISYLADISDFGKEDINDHWEKMPFNLMIKDHLGNCMWCIKKSELRLALAERDEPEFYQKFIAAVNGSGVRVIEDRETPVQYMYRGGKKLEQVIAVFASSTTEELRERVKYTKSGQCESSCDILNDDDEIELPKEISNKKEINLMETKEQKKYSIIYADPPWQFSNVKTGGSLKSGANSKYMTTSIEDLKAMDVNSLAADDALLVMWWVGSMPQEAIDLVNAWGFTLKNMNGIVWNKLTVNNNPHFGMGFYTRAGSESCLIATKGKFKPASRSVRAVFRAEEQIQFEGKILRHSEKPKQVRELIVELAGDLPRLEMFNRDDSWDVFGNESKNTIVINEKNR